MADTCIFIQQEKQGGNFDLSQWGEDIIYISAITASELLVGVHRANNEARRIRRTVFVDAILAQMPILDFTLEIGFRCKDFNKLKNNYSFIFMPQYRIDFQ